MRSLAVFIGGLVLLTHGWPIMGIILIVVAFVG
jgi:hypothetical protein